MWGAVGAQALRGRKPFPRPLGGAPRVEAMDLCVGI